MVATVKAGTVGRQLVSSENASQVAAFKEIMKLLKNADLNEDLYQELLNACISGIDKGTKGINKLLLRYGMEGAEWTLEHFAPAFNTHYKALITGNLSRTSFALNASNSVATEVCQRWNRTVAKSNPMGMLERVAEPDCCDWCAERNGVIMSAAKFEGVFGHENCKCYVVPLD